MNNNNRTHHGISREISTGMIALSALLAAACSNAGLELQTTAQKIVGESCVAENLMSEEDLAWSEEVGANYDVTPASEIKFEVNEGADGHRATTAFRTYNISPKEGFNGTALDGESTVCCETRCQDPTCAQIACQPAIIEGQPGCDSRHKCTAFEGDFDENNDGSLSPKEKKAYERKKKQCNKAKAVCIAHVHIGDACGGAATELSPTSLQVGSRTP